MSEVRLGEGDHGPTLENGLVRVTVNLNSGTYQVVRTDMEHPRIEHAATSVSLTGGPTFSSRGSGFESEGSIPVDDGHGRGLTVILLRERDEAEPDLRLSLTLYEDQPFLVTETEIANTTRAALHVASLQTLDQAHVDLGSPALGWRFYKESWQDWSPALVLPIAGEDLYMAPPVIGPATQPPQQDGRFLSEMVTSIVDPASSLGVTAGFITTANQFSQLWLDREKRLLTAASYADSIELPPGTRLSSERLLIDISSEPLNSLERYGDTLAREMRATPWPAPVSGWCSWYYYWHGVSEADILTNLEAITLHRSELPIEYIQIDDGYQAGIGDWLSVNEKFPHGMRWLVDRIHEKGFHAGIWVAPFLIGANSRLWQERPNWAVQHKPGRPSVAMINWDQDCYALDLTRPDVIEWLEIVFRTIFDEWGFDYIKIDFIYAGAVDGSRFDPNVTRAQAYRRGIQTIRNIAGDRFILGCGNPIGPSIGIVNGSRIGPDVAPFWRPIKRPDSRNRSDLSEVSTLNAIRNTLSRFWMHDRVWLNDPDCLLARDSETALTEDEVHSLATVIGLSGGMVLDSDNLTRLSEDRRRIISLLLPPYGRSATPLDLFQSEMPGLFELDCAGHKLLAVFNWKDDPVTVDVPLPSAGTHVFEVWSQEYLGVHRDRISSDIPAHGVKLLGLRPALDRPQIVGSSFHLLQGACELLTEDWDGEALLLSLRPVAIRAGAFIVHAPCRFGTPILDRGTGAVTQKGDDVWEVRLTLGNAMDLSLGFGG